MARALTHLLRMGGTGWTLHRTTWLRHRPSAHPDLPLGGGHPGGAPGLMRLPAFCGDAQGNLRKEIGARGGSRFPPAAFFSPPSTPVASTKVSGYSRRSARAVARSIE